LRRKFLKNFSNCTTYFRIAAAERFSVAFAERKIVIPLTENRQFSCKDSIFEVHISTFSVELHTRKTSDVNWVWGRGLADPKESDKGLVTMVKVFF